MKNILLFSVLFLTTMSLAFSQINWNGSVSSNWNIAANWTPANIPDAGNEDAVINGAGTFQPVLPANITIRDLTMSGGTLNLGGNTLTVRNSNTSGASISNGQLRATDFTAMANMVFNGTIIITKAAGGNNDLQGNNTFNGPSTITNLSNNRFRFANTNGDRFNTSLIVNKNSSGNIEMAFSGTNNINNLTINNGNTGGQMNFGVGGGTSTLVTGGLLTTTGFVGTLVINNMTQSLNVANSSFTLAAFTVSNSTFLGSFQVTTTGAINFNGNNNFSGNNIFVAGNGITMPTGKNSFSNHGNSTTITRNGGGAVTWAPENTFGNLTLTDNSIFSLTMTGGNTFNGNTLITNNSNTNLRFANTIGDTFNGLVTFQNNGSALMDIAMDIAYRGENVFAQQITINNTGATGEVRFGQFGGTSVLLSGGLVTNDFAVCKILEINNFTQRSNAPNGPVFNTVGFTSSNSTFLGDFAVNTTGIGVLTFTGGNRYDGTNIFNSNNRIVMTGANVFSTISGKNSQFIKGPASTLDDTWEGGNTFGPVKITNNSTNRLRMANVYGDTFLGTSTFINNGTSFEIARSGTNSFGDNITINNLNAGGTMSFGSNEGTSTLNSGGLLTTNFNVGAALTLTNFIQVSNDANGSFTMNTFLSNGTTLRGDFSVTTTNTGITISNRSSFFGNNTFTAATGIALTGGNTFSTISNIRRTKTTMIKNGSTNNEWEGGNTFGDFNLINNGTGRIKTGIGGLPDDFIGDVNFRKNSSGTIEPAFSNVSRFAGDISTVGSNSVLIFGLEGGTVEINGSTAQKLITDGTLIPLFNRVRMNGTGTFELADPVTISISLELFNGIINNNENLLSFLPGLFVTGGSNASHVNGRIRKIGNTEFTYPFGNDRYYAPLTMSALPGAPTQHFTGRYFHRNPDDIPYNRNSKEPSIGVVNACEYWEFANTNSTAKPTLTLSWSKDRTCPIDDYNEFMVTKWNGSLWTDLGQADLVGNATSGTVRNQKETPNFSPGIFTLSQSFKILPIELLSFTAAITDNDKIKISWSTAMEKNNAFFTLEKSFDGSKWFTIGIIPGAGDSDVILFYEFIDESPVFGRQFYRLTQTDFDGKFETFKVVGVTLQSKNEAVEYKVYPNPSNGIVKILSLNNNMEEAEIIVLDIQGKLVKEIKGISGRLVEIDLSFLSKGLYLIKIKNNHYWETKKVVIH
jgi:hypothetical protein